MAGAAGRLAAGEPEFPSSSAPRSYTAPELAPPPAATITASSWQLGSRFPRSHSLGRQAAQTRHHLWWERWSQAAALGLGPAREAGGDPLPRPHADVILAPTAHGKETLGSALPDPVTAPRVLPRIGPCGPDSAGEGSPGPQIAGGWRAAAGEREVRVCARVTPTVAKVRRAGGGVHSACLPLFSPEAGVSPGRQPAEAAPRAWARRAAGGRGLGPPRGARAGVAGGLGGPAAALGNTEQALCFLSSQCPSYIVFCS